MTCRDLLQIPKSQIEINAQLEESEMRVTDIFGDKNRSVMRVTRPVDGKIEVFEITAKKLCVYDGL